MCDGVVDVKVDRLAPILCRDRDGAHSRLIVLLDSFIPRVFDLRILYIMYILGTIRCTENMFGYFSEYDFLSHFYD